MPGVLIIESMAQIGGLLLLSEVADREKKLLYYGLPSITPASAAPSCPATNCASK